MAQHGQEYKDPAPQRKDQQKQKVATSGNSKFSIGYINKQQNREIDIKNTFHLT